MQDWKTSADCSTHLYAVPSDYQICKESVLEESAFGLELKAVSAEDARARKREVIDHGGLMRMRVAVCFLADIRWMLASVVPGRYSCA